MTRAVLTALLVAAAALTLSSATALGRQTHSAAAAIPAGYVTFNGSVPTQLALHPWELAALPQRTITVTFQENGKTVTHIEQGPYLADALTFAGWQPIAASRGLLQRGRYVETKSKRQ
jgi:glucose/arabinose dehydrogenase